MNSQFVQCRRWRAREGVRSPHHCLNYQHGGAREIKKKKKKQNSHIYIYKFQKGKNAQECVQKFGLINIIIKLELQKNFQR